MRGRAPTGFQVRLQRQNELPHDTNVSIWLESHGADLIFIKCCSVLGSGTSMRKLGRPPSPYRRPGRRLHVRHGRAKPSHFGLAARDVVAWRPQAARHLSLRRGDTEGPRPPEVPTLVAALALRARVACLTGNRLVVGRRVASEGLQGAPCGQRRPYPLPPNPGLGVAAVFSAPRPGGSALPAPGSDARRLRRPGGASRHQGGSGGAAAAGR